MTIAQCGSFTRTRRSRSCRARVSGRGLCHASGRFDASTDRVSSRRVQPRDPLGGVSETIRETRERAYDRPHEQPDRQDPSVVGARQEEGRAGALNRSALRRFLASIVSELPRPTPRAVRLVLGRAPATTESVDFSAAWHRQCVLSE